MLEMVHRKRNMEIAKYYDQRLC
ncbi:hypothetical protein OH492_02595 [Vibrio chagasii]|nr:hypothetical protein [Vibrio chagasii]